MTSDAAADAAADDGRGPGVPDFVTNPQPGAEPHPVRSRSGTVAAQLDVATLAAEGIPAYVVEPDGPASGHPMAMLGADTPAAIVMVPADRAAEARLLLSPAAEADRADLAADSDFETDSEPRRAPRPMPFFARLGLVLAILLVLIGIFGAIATLFIGP